MPFEIYVGNRSGCWRNGDDRRWGSVELIFFRMDDIVAIGNAAESVCTGSVGVGAG